MERPEFVTEEHLVFLDHQFECGISIEQIAYNACDHLQAEFFIGLGPNYEKELEMCQKIVDYWLAIFKEREGESWI